MRDLKVDKQQIDKVIEKVKGKGVKKINDGGEKWELD